MRRTKPETIYVTRRAAAFNRLVTETHLDELDSSWDVIATTGSERRM